MVDYYYAESQAMTQVIGVILANKEKTSLQLKVILKDTVIRV